ncbi:hypothetical protein AGMMS50256_37570 [Betaproteobacteria bacterium]|nr:hypothetical protein AGMMS50256_37570 [Betaproteobacteria bacterium]
MTDRNIWPERGAKPEKNGGMRIICPHCGQDAKIRTSRWLTRLTKEAYAQCQNVKCCHVWRVILSGTDTAVPPLTPNPDVYPRQNHGRILVSHQGRTPA